MNRTGVLQVIKIAADYFADLSSANTDAELFAALRVDLLKIHKELSAPPVSALTVPALTVPALTVPDGWKLVPIEPTKEMVLAPGALRTGGHVARIHRDVWKRMMEAAPTAPAAQGDAKAAS